jgi:pilus assembly protein CpaF
MAWIEPMADGTDRVALKRAIIDSLFGSVDLVRLAGLEREGARPIISEIVAEMLNLRHAGLSGEAQARLIAEIGDDVFGFGPLEPLLARDDVTDIMVIGPNRCFIERAGRIEPASARFDDVAQLHALCQKIAALTGRRVDEQSPLCDARLPDGSRVNIVLPPLALDGPVLSIRRFRARPLSLADLVRRGAISEDGAELLAHVARSRRNLLVCGGAGAGKTTLLNCLAGEIDAGERIITCEDAAELQLQQPHVVRLETRTANLEGAGAVGMGDLLRNSLRMRPDRIIVGEVRGAEAFHLLQAMNTGHDGSMGTLHANSPADALRRLEGMVLMGGQALGGALPLEAIRGMIASALDIIIHAVRFPDGSRRIARMCHVRATGGDVLVLDDRLRLEMMADGPRWLVAADLADPHDAQVSAPGRSHG